MDVLYLIFDYIDRHLFMPSDGWDEYEIKKRSIQRWAALEICRIILFNTENDVITNIENFIFKYSMYGGTCNSKENNFICESIVETAENILDYVT